MTKIKEDHVSFEIAKLLKEKGFNEICRAAYTDDGKFITNHNYYSQSEDGYIAPTLQMTMKWLREKDIYITIIYGDYPSRNKVYWTPQIDSLEGFDLPDSFYEEYNKYEEAVEAALKYSLENLI